MLSLVCRYVDKKEDEHDDDGISVSAAAADAIDCPRDVNATVGASDVIQELEERNERSGVVCAGLGEQDDVIIFTGRLLTQLYA